MLCFMTLVKYEASIKLLTTTPVYELLQSALTIGTCPKKNNYKTDQQKQEPCLLSVIDDIHTARSPFWTDNTSVAYVLKTTPSLKSAGKPNTLQNKIMSIVLDLFQNSSWSIIIVKEIKEYCFYREEMCDAMLPWKQNFWISTIIFLDRDGRPFVLSNDGRKIPATLSLLSAIMHKKFFVVVFSPPYWQDHGLLRPRNFATMVVWLLLSFTL